MEGPVDILKQKLSQLLIQLQDADNENEAIDIARSHPLDQNVTVSMIQEAMRELDPELFDMLHIDHDTTCTEFLQEIASVIHTGHQDEDDDDEEDEDSLSDFVVSNREAQKEIKSAKRKLREEEEEEELIGHQVRKHIRTLKELAPNQRLFKKLFALEKDNTATLDQLACVIDALHPHDAKWPRSFQKIFNKIQDY